MEQALPAIGHENIRYGSWMNKALLAFVTRLSAGRKRPVTVGVTVVCARCTSHCVGNRSFISKEALKKEPFGLKVQAA